MDQETRNELRRRKLCFHCKEHWEPGHRCPCKGKVHLIEVISDGEDDHSPDTEVEDEGGDHDAQGEQPQIERGEGEALDSSDVTIATLSGVPRYHPFRLKGVLKGQWIVCLVDSGATHNFIDEGLAAKRGLQVEEFDGFSVRVADGFAISCTKRIPRLSIQMGDYTLTDDFYVIGLGEIDTVLGIQWLQSLGRYVQDFRKMELEFMVDKKKIVLRGLSDGGPRVVSTRRMESIVRHGKVAWVA